MTIVNICSSVKFYPLTRISAGALALLEQTVAGDAARFHPKLGYKTLFGLLECYLDLRSKEVTAKTLRSSKSDTLFAGFVGALRSADFVALGISARTNYVSTFRRLLTTLQCKHSNGLLIDNEKCDAIWTAAELTVEAATYWQGWLANSQSGHSLHLHWIWRILGEECCTGTHAALATYWAGRPNSVSNSASLFNQFFSFLAALEPKPPDNTLSDQNQLHNAILKFCRYYFERAAQVNLDISVARKRWNDWKNVIEEALFKGRTWARVDIPYAGPGKDSASNWIRQDKDGQLVKVKFLVRIPLEISDTSAIDSLIQEVDNGVESVVAWCTHLMSETMASHFQLETLAKSGTDLLEAGRIVGNNRKVSPSDLAATFLNNGLDMFQQKAHFSGVTNFTAAETARILAIPVSNTLDPFLYLLINQHQEITSAFLKSIEVCGESLNEKCIRRTDSGYVLVGYKNRRGPTLSEQVILLNERSLELVQNLINVTAPLRDWMRKNGIKGWNRLLLNCSKGLSTPAFVGPTSRNSSPSMRAKQQVSIAPFYKGDTKNIEVFSQKVSLANFRATKALSLYFKDGDEIALAHRLGHKRYSSDLMGHYLPKAFRNHMRSRSILITQTLIVAQAMKDSPLQIEATGFTTAEQLEAFLNTHKLRDLDVRSSRAEIQSSYSRILINIDPRILGQLAALEVASTQAKFRIKHDLIQWIDFGKMLFAEGKRQRHDSKLQAKLVAAEKAGRTDEYLNLVKEY